MNRRSAALLFLLLIAPIVAKAVSDNVLLVRMVTNDKHVVILYLNGEYNNGSQQHYTIACNQVEATCVVPSKGHYYHMESSGQSVYKCPEVTLSEMEGHKETVGVYCLHEVN